MKLPLKKPRVYKKDPEQLLLQKLIEDHYPGPDPEPEKYQILESKINK